MGQKLSKSRDFDRREQIYKAATDIRTALKSAAAAVSSPDLLQHVKSTQVTPVLMS